jgi:hypothetical protein
MIVNCDCDCDGCRLSVVGVVVVVVVDVVVVVGCGCCCWLWLWLWLLLLLRLWLSWVELSTSYFSFPGDTDDFFKSFLGGFSNDISTFAEPGSALTAAARNRRNRTSTGQKPKKAHWSMLGCGRGLFRATSQPSQPFLILEVWRSLKQNKVVSRTESDSNTQTQISNSNIHRYTIHHHA